MFGSRAPVSKNIQGCAFLPCTVKRLLQVMRTRIGNLKDAQQLDVISNVIVTRS
jgi:hypothetical protein